MRFLFRGRRRHSFRPARALGWTALALLLSPVLPAAEVAASAATVWVLDNLKQVNGLTPKVEGAPKIEKEKSGSVAIAFDGKVDGMFLPVNPVAGWSQFTIEILFRPEIDGGAEQRFLHFQDNGGQRGLIELRLDREGKWWLDTYLKPSVAEGVALIDPKKTHPAGRWYWAALRYDGKRMTSFVNGEKELEGELNFEPMGAGQTSLGVRQTHISWFKGAIREVRFHPVALAPEKLQRQ